MPVLLVDDGNSSAKLGHYLHFNREGGERIEAFTSNSSARNIQDAEREFQHVRNTFNKKDGREFFQAYISFEKRDLGSLARPDGMPDWERINRYGMEWARRAGIADKHQLYIVAHGDKPHPHIHIVWNATTFENGRKYQYDALSKNNDRDRLRDINDQLAREHGIKRVLDRTPDHERATDGVLRTAEKGGDQYSWKMDLQSRIRAAASESLGERQFREELSKRSIKLTTRAGDYTYAFKDERDKQRLSRGRKLGEEYRRGPLMERFELHNKIAREPGGFAGLAERAKRERESFDSWKRDLRGLVNEGKRRAHDWQSFEAALEKRGVRVAFHADSAKERSMREGEPRYRFTGSDGVAREIAAGALGRVYGSATIEKCLDENAFRRVAVSEIRKAANKAHDQQDFSKRLSGRGIELARVGDRYVYRLPYNGETRAVEGERLGPAFRTERIEERFTANRDRQELYQTAMQVRHGSSNRADYVRRLAERGIGYHVAEDGRATLTYKGHSYDAGRLGNANPDRAQEGHGVNIIGRAGREVTGLARAIGQEVSRASHEGYHDHGDHGRERERTRKRGNGMDSGSAGNEPF